MLRLTDTDGDPLLVQEHYILRMVTFRMPPGVRSPHKIEPKTVIIQADNQQVAVTESIEDIECILRGYGGPERQPA